MSLWRVSSFTVLCLASCVPPAGGEGKACSELAECLPGLACSEGVCRDPKVLCAGKQCGLVGGVSCGVCAGATEVCASNACVNVCTDKECGMSSGLDCGPCSGATEVCTNNLCVDVCTDKECGMSSGLDCGPCSGATEVCTNNLCVDVCEGRCGTVDSFACGSCSGGDPCVAGYCEAYVLIPAGTFSMGSPPDETGRGSNETQHSVTLTGAFWLKATEVTQAEWRTVMSTNPSGFSTCGDTCPVESVSWDDAVDYVNALSRAQGLAECYGGTASSRTFAGIACTGYRLPTEAEWEYATRAASTTALTNGPLQGSQCAGGANLDAVAWYCGNGSTTHPVAQKAANAWGLYDVHGNVFEWTHDWYGNYPMGAATDPIGAAADVYRVFRGGGWGYIAEGCRSAARGGLGPAVRDGNVGFRPARTIP